MSPWDLYGQILVHLGGGRLTMEQVGSDLRFEWWPAPGRMVAYHVSIREFQGAKWEIGSDIAAYLRMRWETCSV